MVVPPVGEGPCQLELLASSQSLLIAPAEVVKNTRVIPEATATTGFVPEPGITLLCHALAEYHAVPTRPVALSV